MFSLILTFMNKLSFTYMSVKYCVDKTICVFLVYKKKPGRVFFLYPGETGTNVYDLKLTLTLSEFHPWLMILLDVFCSTAAERLSTKIQIFRQTEVEFRCLFFQIKRNIWSCWQLSSSLGTNQNCGWLKNTNRKMTASSYIPFNFWKETEVNFSQCCPCGKLSNRPSLQVTPKLYTQKVYIFWEYCTNSMPPFKGKFPWHLKSE